MAETSIGIIDGTLAPPTRSEMVRVLAPEPLPSSAIITSGRQAVEQFVRVRLDHSRIGARQAVLGQECDGFE